MGSLLQVWHGPEGSGMPISSATYSEDGSVSTRRFAISAHKGSCGTSQIKGHIPIPNTFFYEVLCNRLADVDPTKTLWCDDKICGVFPFMFQPVPGRRLLKESGTSTSILSLILCMQLQMT